MQLKQQLRREFVAINAYIEKEESQTNNFPPETSESKLNPQQAEERRQNSTAINKRENKQYLGKIHETKSLLL